MHGKCISSLHTRVNRTSAAYDHRRENYSEACLCARVLEKDRCGEKKIIMLVLYSGIYLFIYLSIMWRVR